MSECPSHGLVELLSRQCSNLGKESGQGECQTFEILLRALVTEFQDEVEEKNS